MALVRRPARTLVTLALAGLVSAAGAVAWKTNVEAHRMVTHPKTERKLPSTTPASRNLPFEETAVTTRDGLRLHGWWIPGSTDAAVLLVHGYKDHRGSVLGVAEVLHRHGFGVLVASLRAHDINDGDLITFGLREGADLDAWYGDLRQRPGVAGHRIGLFGVSMGGTIAIRHASENPGIRALIADCAFSSASDTIETSVRFFTGLPAFPFANGILFWIEREIGGAASELDATRWIRAVAPRPVLLMQGGADRVVSADSGARLFAAAGSPKELWFEPALGHAEFLAKMPDAFEARVSAFLAGALK